MKNYTSKERIKLLFSLPVVIAALGYFVDIFDLLLFGIVRVPSLETLQLDIDKVGTLIINWQMSGLLIGGILWEILGNKKGRLSVLFGSILVDSIANILCGFLPHLPHENIVTIYASLRFIAGIGLAGELGAGITLVSESLPKDLRAIGTSIVAGFGLLGAVAAQLSVQLASDWTISYFIGGAMGLALLILRISVSESGIYKEIAHDSSVKKGNFIMFFTNKERFIKYIKCIFIGLPTWYCIGILAVMANQFAPAMGIEKLEPGKAIMWAYIGISAGDFFSGFLSHYFNSRKKAILYMLLFTIIGVLLLLGGMAKTDISYYFFCTWLGCGTGYWAMFASVGAGQFGTNIRRTAATTIPNMVRGLLPIMLLGFDSFKTSTSVITSAFFIGIIVFFLAIYATLTIPETHNIE